MQSLEYEMGKKKKTYAVGIEMQPHFKALT